MNTRRNKMIIGFSLILSLSFPALELILYIVYPETFYLQNSIVFMLCWMLSLAIPLVCLCFLFLPSKKFCKSITKYLWKQIDATSNLFTTSIFTTIAILFIRMLMKDLSIQSSFQFALLFLSIESAIYFVFYYKFLSNSKRLLGTT